MTRKQGDVRLHPGKSLDWQLHAAFAIFAAVAVHAAATAVLPAGLVLPAYSAAALATGAGLALYGWMRGIRPERDRLTCWDYASTCVFLGFAAGTLGNPEHVALISGGLPNL
jgi:hypothetical protein